MPSPLADPVKLPCGLVLPNRLSKAAMAELMAKTNHPTDLLVDAYEQWSDGGWGSILTGNVQVDVNHMGSPFDPALHNEYKDAERNADLVAQWKKYADAGQKHGTPVIAQICHPGRQSFRVAGHRGMFAQTLAPSAVPINLGDGYLERLIGCLAWSTPKEMSTQDVERVIGQFVDTARLMADAGFSGVELHGAHGYLIDQFLNEKTNLRTDEYGGTPEKRARFVLEILTQTRQVVPPTFCIGIKLNSADHSSTTFEETMTQIALLASAGIDFMEISGGSYEDPAMMGYAKAPRKSARTAAREAFFLEFSKEVRLRHPGLVLMLTGGFRSRAGAEAAVQDGACDVVGIGRPAAVDPKFPRLLLDESVGDAEARFPLNKAPVPWYTRFLPAYLIGAGAESMPSETEPLLPRYEDDTSRQRRLHQKLHSYQMIRAISEGYLPTTEQMIANLRTLLASDVLNLRNQDIGSVGRQLVRDLRLWIQVFIEFLHQKNHHDQLQEFLWRLSRSRVEIDSERVSRQAAHVKARADTKAAYDSFRTVGGLLLTNADFRLFVDDLVTVGRQIFADTAESLAESSKLVAKEVQPSAEDESALNGAGADEGHELSKDELREEVAHVAEAAGEGIAHTGHDALESAKEHLSGRERDTLLFRLKQAVQNLRERTDYSDSVATLAQLLQRYAKIYAEVAENTTSTAEEDVQVNVDLKRAVDQFWILLRSFGSAEEWDRLQEKFHNVLRHANKDPEFDTLLGETGNSLQAMLTDPDFFDSAPQKLDELKKQSEKVGPETSLRKDMDDFLAQTKQTLRTVPEDPAVYKLINATKKVYQHAWGAYNDNKADLPADLVNVFLPVLLRMIQYIPIPRLEISAPEIDLLLENLILEPGHTVHFSSFLPYRMHLLTRNDIDVIKTHSKRTETLMKTAFTITVQGLNISAEDFGYWFRTHTGLLFNLKDEGIASFYLDRRGIDISLDVEVGRDRLEHIFSLRGVRVRIHKLDYQVKRSRWRFLLWLTKPFLKHLIRRVLEKKIAEEIVAAAFTLNRELVFARERLRAARIANPQDLATFVKAVLARLKPADSDVEARIGIRPLKYGAFQDVYAPGSIVKTWRDEATRAQEAIEDGDETHGIGHTWHNDIFDVAGH
ncbi:unnamed protein product [Penicillium olsonii]|nr:unnamed protein product [Penicillium olsonii]